MGRPVNGGMRRKVTLRSGRGLDYADELNVIAVRFWTLSE